MPPYDTLVWSEGKAAAATLTGVTAGFGTAAARTTMSGYTSSGDYYQLLKGYGDPYVCRLWGFSITKCLGSALSGNRSQSQQKFLGPGSSNALVSRGTVNLKLRYQQGELLTAYNAVNADEYGLVCADVAYGAPLEYPKDLDDAVKSAGIKELFCIDTSITTTSGSCTNSDGKVALDTATQEDLWLDSEGSYTLLGIQPCRGLANGGGALIVTGLGGDWTGRYPGLPMPEQSGVDFDNDVPVFFPKGGIPFKGDALPSVHVVSPTAGAIPFGLYIGKK